MEKRKAQSCPVICNLSPCSLDGQSRSVFAVDLKALLWEDGMLHSGVKVFRKTLDKVGTLSPGC